MNPFEKRRLKNFHPKFIHIPVKKYDLKCETTEEKRIYYSPDTNKKLVSVTSMLGKTNLDKDVGLKLWKERIGEKAAEKETERCSIRGESVHLMAEQWLNNEKIKYSIHSKNAVSLFERLVICLNDINNIHAQEIALYSDLLGIAGRVDCIGEYKGILSVIDFKTSTKEKFEKWIGDYFLQCSAYSYLFEEMYNIKIPQIVVLIAVEGLTVPQIFVSQRDKFRKPLLKRILQYREGIKNESN